MSLMAGTYTVTVTDNDGCTTTTFASITQPAAPLTAGISAQTNVSCFGGNNGAATVTATGGTPAYSYIWSTSPAQSTSTATTLMAGTYTVTVTDSHGCTTTTSASITQPATPLSAGISAQTNVSCFGGNNGAATVTATGGTPAYSYMWSTSPAQTTSTATTLMAGTYTVTVTDNHGCTTSTSASITQPGAPLSAGISAQTNVKCFGGNNGAATVTVTGGTPAYGYMWSTSPAQTTSTATTLMAGTYTVTVTDSHGCTTTTSASITQPGASVTAGISAQTNVNCFGGNNGAATVTVTGGTPAYSYMWSTSPVQTTSTAMTLMAGTYTVTVTDNQGCTTTTSASITQPAAPLSAGISAQTNVSCFGGSNGAATVTVTGGTPSYSYIWSTSPVQTTSTATTLMAGTYTVTVTDSHGCTTTTSASITQPAAPLSAGISAQTNVSCFGGNNGAATVTATGGTPAYSYMWSTSPAQTTSTATTLMAGTYTVTVTDSHGCTTTTSASITQPAAPLSAGISAQTNVSCFGGNDGAATVTATGGTPGYNYMWSTSPAQTTSTATSLLAGLYVVTVTDTHGCTTIAIATITQPFAALTAGISGKTNVSCFGGNDGAATVTVSGGTNPYGYLWSTVPPQTSPTATSLSAGTYTVTVTDNHNCTTTTSVNIIQPLTPLGLTASVSAVNCNGGSTGSICITVTGGTPNYVYIWSNGVSANGAVNFTHCITGLSSGSYTVTVTDAHNCSLVRSWTVTQPAQLIATASSTPITCGQTDGTATVSATGGNGGYTYKWSNNGTTQTIVGLSAGTYTATVTDSKGCTSASSTSISQPTPPPILQGPDQFICNQSETFLVGSNPAPGVGNWTEYTGPNTALIFPPNSQTAIATGLIPGIYQFIYSVTLGTCTSRDTIMVTNYHFPTPSYAGPDQFLCKMTVVNDSTNMAANTPLFGTGMWSQISGPTSAVFVQPTNPNTKVKNLAVGMYVFQWAISNGICDPSVSTVNVTVHDVPMAYAGKDSTICGNMMYTVLDATASNYTGLQWLTTGTGYFNNSTLLHPTYVPSAADILAGQVKLILVAKGYQPCPDAKDTLVLTLTAPPVANAGPDEQICEGSTFCLCGAYAYHYTSVWWTTTGCGTFNNPNVLNPIYTPCPQDIIDGCVKLVMHVQGVPPCGEVTDTMVLCIRRIPIVYAGPDTTICNNETYTNLLSTALYQIGLKWITSGDGTFDKDTILHPTYTPGPGDILAGQVKLTLIGIACAPCPNDTDSMILHLNPPPIAHAYVISEPTCYGSSDGVLSVSVIDGGTPYTYMWSDDAHQTTQTATGLSAGTYTVTVTDHYMCTGTSSATLTNPPMLEVLCVATNIRCYTYSDGAINITASGGTPAYHYMWNNGATTRNISGLSAGTYTVTVTDSRGCTGMCNSTISQPPPWGPQICGPDSVCQGSTVMYCVCQPRRELSTYQWTVTCGTIIDGCCGPCVTILWDHCNTGTICVTETRHDFPYDGCVITTCKTIILKPVPVPVITGPNVVMTGQTTTYCTPFYPGHLYSWSVVDGTVISGQGTNCITVTWNTPCSNCMGQVIAYETLNGCCGTDTMNVTIIPGVGNLTGYVTYKNQYNTGLNGVAVTLRNSSGVVIGTAYTGPNTSNSNQPGFFTFPGIPNGTYRLTAGFNGTWGGNNATDALIIELYTVNLYPLPGIYWKAGDVTNDMSDNATDALWVKLRTVGMVTSYPAGDWTFTDTTFVLNNTAAVNLQGLCVGDVNGSYIPTGMKESSFLSVTDDGTMTVPLNKDFNYTIRSKNTSDLGAMTLFMGYNKDRFEVEDVATQLEGMKYVISDGQIKLAWSNTAPLTVNANDRILTLRMKVKEPITTAQQIFDVQPGSEFANAGAVRYDNYELNMSGVVTSGSMMEFSIMNFPNPFRNTTDIVYTLPEQGHVRLVLTDMFGKELQTLVEGVQTAGSYTIKVDPAEHSLKPGVYLYKIKVDGVTTTYIKTNKMIFTH
jgi:hypothetical protein